MKAIRNVSGLDLSDVSRETQERLTIYASRLVEWQKRINLVGPGTIDQLWSRHIGDCLQLARLYPECLVWADMGSGAGLPGIVLACHLASGRDGHIHLIESNLKKAAFLRAVCVELELPATIHASRIEQVVPRLPKVDAVTARALAPLDQLLGLSNLLLKSGAIGVFPKGRDYQAELTQAGKSWQFSYRLHPSQTEPDARIVEVTMA